MTETRYFLSDAGGLWKVLTDPDDPDETQGLRWDADEGDWIEASGRALRHLQGGFTDWVESADLKKVLAHFGAEP